MSFYSIRSTLECYILHISPTRTNTRKTSWAKRTSDDDSDDDDNANGDDENESLALETPQRKLQTRNFDTMFPMND